MLIAPSWVGGNTHDVCFTRGHRWRNTHDVYFAHLLREINPRISPISPSLISEGIWFLVSGFPSEVFQIPEVVWFWNTPNGKPETRNQIPPGIREGGEGNAWVDLAYK